MSQVDEQLDPLRQEVARLDREILKLVAERLATTRKIGQAKLRAGLPIRDFRVEVQVLSRARKAALEHGFDLEFAEKAMELLMSGAVQTQAELPHGQPTAGARKVLVVGGAGRMGLWLSRFFEAQGHTVHICDQSEGEVPWSRVTLSEGVAQADVVVLATPLKATPQVLREVLEVEGDPLIFDICSLKSQVAPLLKQAAEQGRRVTSLHPMFAPGAVLLHGRAVLVCDAGCRRATDQAKELFADTALGLYEFDLLEHDKIMAVVLGMSHAVNLQFAGAVARFGLPFDFLGKVASTTFAKQVKTTAEVAEENPALYHEIQNFNAVTPDMFDLLSDSLERLRQASLQRDGQAFLDFMNECRGYLTGAAAGRVSS